MVLLRKLSWGVMAERSAPALIWWPVSLWELYACYEVLGRSVLLPRQFSGWRPLGAPCLSWGVVAEQPAPALIWRPVSLWERYASHEVLRRSVVLLRLFGGWKPPGAPCQSWGVTVERPAPQLVRRPVSL